MLHISERYGSSFEISIRLFSSIIRSIKLSSSSTDRGELVLDSP